MGRGKMMLLVLVMGIFLLSSVSALELMNTKSYNAEEKQVTIESTFLWLFPTGKVADIKLNTPLVYNVMRGKDRLVAEFTINNYEAYSDGVFDGMKFLDLKNKNREIQREFTYKYKVVIGTKEIPVYKQVCDSFTKNDSVICKNEIVSYNKEDVYAWKEFTAEELKSFPRGEITIGVFTDVQAGDYIEWIPTLYGKEIGEWAVWNDAFNYKLDMYFQFNNSLTDMINGKTFSQTAGSSVYGDGGIRGRYVYVDTGNKINLPDNEYLGGNNQTLNFWINNTGTTAGKVWFHSNGGYMQLTGGVISWANICGSGTAMSEGKNMITIKVNSSGNFCYKNGVLDSTGAFAWEILNIGFPYQSANGGDSEWVDEVGLWNRSLTESEISQLYDGGTGTFYSEIPADNPPIVEINSPVSYYNSSSVIITFNGSASDNRKIENISFWLNGERNETYTLSSGNYTNLTLSRILADGVYNWTYSATDNATTPRTTFATNRTFKIDTINPGITSFTINQSGVIFGWPKILSVWGNESDASLGSCWYNLDYNVTNQTFSCNTPIEINNVIEGNRTMRIYVNDTFGWRNETSLNFSVNYYTHNVTYKDAFNSSLVLTPSCSFEGESQSAYEYHFDIHNITARNVSCYLLGYNNIVTALNESNFTQQTMTMNPVYLNLTFDALTNVSLTYIGGGLTYSNILNVTTFMRGLYQGDIQVAFNEGTQIYSFNNDRNTTIEERLHLEVVDFDQPVKVLAGNDEISDTLVTFKKVVGSAMMTTYSAFTDVNGVAHIIINDGNSYEVHAVKEGYEEWSDVVYIPTSNTETLIINLIGESGFTANYIFNTNCPNHIGQAMNCSFYVKSFSLKNITFNYTYGGNNYQAVSQGSEANLTLFMNETLAPLNMTISVNPTKYYYIEYEGLGARSIQLTFDTATIKDAGIGILGLFYGIILILGVLIMVSVNRMPKMKGFGIIGMAVWFGIIAVWFPIFWFLVIPIGIYFVIKTLWGED